MTPTPAVPMTEKEISERIAEALADAQESGGAWASSAMSLGHPLADAVARRDYERDKQVHARAFLLLGEAIGAQTKLVRAQSSAIEEMKKQLEEMRDEHSNCWEMAEANKHLRSQIEELKRERDGLIATAREVQQAVYEGSDYRFTWDPTDLPAMIRIQRVAADGIADGWRNRSDAAESSLSTAQETIRAYEDSCRRVMNEECAPDEKHCTCVPALRETIERQKRELEHMRSQAGPDSCADYVTRLHAAQETIERLRKGLESVQWSGSNFDAHCPSCEWEEDDGHDPDCELAALLTNTEMEGS